LEETGGTAYPFLGTVAFLTAHRAPYHSHSGFKDVHFAPVIRTHEWLAVVAIIGLL